jgi:hypothetical protein
MRLVVIGGTGLIGSKLSDRSLVPSGDPGYYGVIRYEDWSANQAAN